MDTVVVIFAPKRVNTDAKRPEKYQQTLNIECAKRRENSDFGTVPLDFTRKLTVYGVGGVGVWENLVIKPRFLVISCN